jgi:hypothetical protein
VGDAVTIYLSGPISGGGSLDEQKIAENVAAFSAAAAALRAAGHHVVSPVEIGGDDQPGHIRRGWREYMVPALHALLDCDRVVLLPGWSSSVGACLEWYVADQLGMRVEEWAGEVSP